MIPYFFGKRQEAVYLLVTAPQGGTQKYTLTLPTIIHADWSNRPRTAFGDGPRRYIRSWLFRLAVTVFWRALTASWRGAQLTFRNNQIQILQTSSTLGTTQPWQSTSLSKIPTHTARGCHTHARTYNARQRDKKADSPAAHSQMGGEMTVVLQQQRMVNWDLSLASHIFLLLLNKYRV